MRWVEIGVGVMLAGVGSFGFYASLPVGLVFLIAGGALIAHGVYEELFRPWLFLEGRVTKWLLERNWSVRTDQAAKARLGFYFALEATDAEGRTVAITRGRDSKHVMAFSAKVMLDRKWLPYMEKLTVPERKKLLEDIRVLVAIKSIAFDGLEWPLLHFSVQDAQPIDQVLSEHKVDITAKNVTHAMIGARSIIRRSIADLEGE